MKNRIKKLLLKSGISPSFQGFHYLVTAIDLVIEDEYLLDRAVKRLYPAVAKEHQTTVGSVKRSIRYAVLSAYNADASHFNILDLCPIFESYKPTNKQFISVCREILLMGEDHK